MTSAMGCREMDPKSYIIFIFFTNILNGILKIQIGDEILKLN